MGKQTLKIGSYHISVDTDTRHGQLYAKQGWTLDSLVAKHLMRPGDAVLDVGANVGFTVAHYLLNGASSVHAVEPHPDFVGSLCAIDDKVLVHNCALGAKTGTVELFQSQSHNQGHTTVADHVKRFSKVYGDDPKPITVPLKTWDGLLSDFYFDFVKIDAEGAEFSILKGGSSSLKFRTPRVLQLEAYTWDFEAIYDYLCPLYTYCYRMAHTKDGGLVVMDWSHTPPVVHSPGLVLNPPTYVFTSSRIP